MTSSRTISFPIDILIADSSRMQAQLLISALRRRPEFKVAACQMETVSRLRAVAQNVPRILLLSMTTFVGTSETVTTLRRIHLSHPDIPKVLLVETVDRELVVSAFRSGARGIFCIADSNLRLLCKCLLRVAEGQIWANTEQLNYILELISEVPSLRVLNSNGENLLTPRRRRTRRRRAQQSRCRGRTQPQRAHRQEISLPHLREAWHFQPCGTGSLRRE